MASFGELQEAAFGLSDKTIGLAREAVGTLLGRDNLASAGRAQQDRGSQRLDAARHEAKADAARVRAAAEERRQRASQSGGQPVRGKGTSEFSRTGPAEAASGIAERVKGKAKEAVGAVTGDDAMRNEARAQQSKGEARSQAAKEEAKSEEARAGARAADLRERGATEADR